MQPQPQRYMPPQPGFGPAPGLAPQFPQQPGALRPGLAPMPTGGLPRTPTTPAGLSSQLASVSLSSQPVMSPSVVKSAQPGPQPMSAAAPRPPAVPPGAQMRPPASAQVNGSPMPPGAGVSQANGAATSGPPSSLQQRYPNASLPNTSPHPGLSPMHAAPPGSQPLPGGIPQMQRPPMLAMPQPGGFNMSPQVPMSALTSAQSPMGGMIRPMAGAPPVPGMPSALAPPGGPPMPPVGGMMAPPMPGGVPPPHSSTMSHPPMPGQPLMSGYPGGPPMPGQPPMPGPGAAYAPAPAAAYAPAPGAAYAPAPGAAYAPAPGAYGQMPPSGPGSMPPGPGGMPPGPGGMPPGPGGMPPGPGGMPPGPGGMPPGPGGMPTGPGGMPSRPGMPGMPGQMGAKRLDPEQMPSPIQVMADDQANRSGQFVTNLKGQVPPLTTTKFTVIDQGNASPRFIRSSMYNVPAAPDMLKQTAIPLALSISPLAELPEGEFPPPVVDLGTLGPVRCIRCKAYMCPFMSFIDGGRRFSCPFCKASTDVPQEYFQHLDHTGQRLDKYDRPELCMGAYEFVCTKEYCRNNEFPKPPAYIFIIDVSYNNVKSGLVHLLCNNMKQVLRQLPIDVGQSATNMKVGFITYSNVVHFFNVKPCLAQPHMMVVGDVQDMFVPLVDGLLVDVTEAEAVIDSLMEELPGMFANTRETEVVLGPAIQAGMEALKAADCAGRLFIFHSSLPIGEAPGKLKNRDDRKVLGSDKEKHVLTPQTQFYNNVGQECVQAGCSVNLFLLNNAYVDLPTIGQAIRLSGGEIYKYTYFQADLDGDRLLRDLSRAVSRPVGFDAIMRVRTSTGVRPVDFHGHFFMSNTTDMEMAAVDSSQAVTVELKHDDKLTDEDGVYIQAALLYTAVSGQRRLRVLNLSLNVCTQMADMYRSCELDTMCNLMVKQAVSKLLDSSPRTIKDSLSSQCAQVLASYRKHCASPSSAGQLILPECMKLLPLYANCILRSDAVTGGPELTIDERSHHMYMVTSLPVHRSVPYLYPRLLPLDGLDADDTRLPAPVRTSQDKLNEQGLFLLENGVHMFLWIGLQADPVLVQDLFAVQSVAQIDVDRPSLPELDTPISIRVRGIIEEVCAQRQCHMKLTVVRQRDKMELVMRHFLVEDKGSDGSPSYVDYLCHLHKEIRALIA